MASDDSPESKQSTVSEWLIHPDIETRNTVSGVAKGNISPLRNEQWLETQCVYKRMDPIEIADELGVTYSIVNKWIDKHNITIQSHSEKTDLLRDESWLRQQYHGNKRTPQDIAQELSVNYDIVTYWMDTYEIERRGGNTAASFNLS